MIDSAQIMRQALQAGRFDVLQNDAFSATQTNKAAVESGQALGFTLQVMDDPTAELMDSMEELSFQFEEKTLKSVAERKLGEIRSARSAYVMAVETWQKTMPDLPGGAFMERMLRNLRQAMQSGQAPDANSLLKMLGEGSRDPSHQFAMIDILDKALQPDEANLKSLLDAAKGELMRTQGPAVRAGVNLAAVVNEKAQSPAEMQGLRDLYRGEVLGFTSPQDCFASLLQSRGAGRLADAIDFLIKGCGVDLQSPSPSQSPEELRRILGDLQCVQVLKTCLDKLSVLSGKMGSQFGEPCLLDGEKLTGRVMDFTKMPFVNAGNIAALVSSCGISQLLAQIYFCTGLIDVFRQLSPRLFEQEADRFRLEDAAQEHLDGLVTQQDEEDRRQQKGDKDGKGGRAA